ncbi:unnamed protein product [Urochloa humidicola]
MGRPYRGQGWFPGYDTYFFGYVNAYPLPRLPSFPIVIRSAPLTSRAATPASPLIQSTPLRLTWYPPPSAARASHPSLPLPPPPSPVASPPPPIAAAVTRRRRGRTALPPQPKRSSSRLADKEPATFVDSTSRAMQRKALQESLGGCSADLKRQVRTRKLLKKKNPIGALDLGRLAKAAGLSCSDRRSVAVAAATGPVP